MTADAVLLLHAAVVLFNVGSLPLIWIGAWRGWRWVRHRGFRLTHAGLIAFVVVESALGMTCPLTRWEDQLRGQAGDAGFIARYVRVWLYWDFPPWVFALAYFAFGALVALTWWRVRPYEKTKP